MSAKFKEVVGVVDNVIVLEKETFEALLPTLKNDFTIEKIVNINLKDYREGKSVAILKVTKEGKSALIISDHLTY